MNRPLQRLLQWRERQRKQAESELRAAHDAHDQVLGAQARLGQARLAVEPQPAHVLQHMEALAEALRQRAAHTEDHLDRRHGELVEASRHKLQVEKMVERRVAAAQQQEARREGQVLEAWQRQRRSKP